MPRVNGYVPGTPRLSADSSDDVERGVQRLDLVRRVGEGDVAQLALARIAPAPLGDLGAQPLELGALVGSSR